MERFARMRKGRQTGCFFLFRSIRKRFGTFLQKCMGSVSGTICESRSPRRLACPGIRSGGIWRGGLQRFRRNVFAFAGRLAVVILWFVRYMQIRFTNRMRFPREMLLTEDMRLVKSSAVGLLDMQRIYKKKNGG